MKKCFVRVVIVLLLIVQNGYLLSADDYKAALDAAQNSQWQDLYELIDGGVDVNEVPDENNDMPFINRAIARNDLKAVQELLNRGAELNIKTYMLPLTLAAKV